jgi:hypothetical protein
MSLRISSAALALVALAACGAQSPAPEGDTIACAIGADAAFAETCTLERVAGTPEIIIHQPDGGFRRFNYDPVAGTVAVTDGAEPLVIEPAEGALQFAVGTDRYRITRETPASPAP